MGYISHRLPDELVQSLSVVMMPDLIPRIKLLWLNSVVPASLKEIDEFQGILSAVRTFCDALGNLNYTGYDELQEWVDSAPRVWLTKCRETALDTVRSKLAQGLGHPKEVERVETQTVSRNEGNKLTANGAPAAGDDENWGAAWDDDGEDNAGLPQDDALPAHGTDQKDNQEDGADAWGWGEEDVAPAQPVETTAPPTSEQIAEDEGGDDWGAWADDAAEQPAPQPVTQRPSSRTQTREMTLRETYKISSMPEPVLALISAILEDGAFLVS